MKIYVGNLPFSVDDKKLEELFSQYKDAGEFTVIKDKFSGRSKGFGFVTVNDEESAKKAISEMNGKEFEGRKLTVNESKPREEGERRSFGGPGRFSGRGQGNQNRGRGRY
ncbi:MAG: RNA-binding protein [Nanoarchaeota archaeon]|nr:RNA-binding protein [Nanoarchaeota archaeon]